MLDELSALLEILLRIGDKMMYKHIKMHEINIANHDQHICNALATEAKKPWSLWNPSVFDSL